MAIGRIAGPLLVSDLDRQGVDLQFSTNGSPLLYLDFANFCLAVNGASGPDKFTVHGSSLLDNITVSGTTISTIGDMTITANGGIVNLDDVSAIKIPGGATNFVLTTDGAGNLSWSDIGNVAVALNLTGMQVVLGNPSDGSLVDNAAYKYFQPTTTVTDAIDELNQVMLNVYQNTYVGSVEFTANVVFGPSPLTVKFTPTIVGNANTFLWDFGDSVGSSSELSPTYTYSDPAGASYSVYFKASNSNGTLGGAGNAGVATLAQGSYADLIRYNYIQLYTPAPIPAFTLDITTVDNGYGVNLTNYSQFMTDYLVNAGGVPACTIDWGDGSTTTLMDNTFVGPGNLAPHTYYNNGSVDAIYQVTITAYSQTAGPTGMSVTSEPTTVRVYNTQHPAMTADVTIGNNQHATLPHGLTVTFTNTTEAYSTPGSTALYPGNLIQWDFGDGSPVLSVPIGSGLPGDLGTTVTHTFAPAFSSTTTTIYNVEQIITNGHSLSPFYSTPLQVTVYPAPTAQFTAAAIVVSDKVGDTTLTAYTITDVNGVDRSKIVFTNTSFNTNTYTWGFGDSTSLGPIAEGAAGTPTGPTVAHPYTALGTHTITLLAHGPRSINGSDDTIVRNNYVNILPAPAAPANLSAKTLSIASVGTNPLLTALATNRSSVSMPSAGSAVNRVTVATPIATDVLTNVYNANSGTLRSVINGTVDATVALTGANDVGTFGTLVITEDKDAHAVDPTVYPSDFYKVFSGQIAKANIAVNAGYNTYQMTHSATGNTNILGFVKDDVTLVPTLDITSATMTTATAGALAYVSGIPYFNVGGSVSILGVQAYNWIGQTYLGTGIPMSVEPGTVVEGTGDGILLQGKSYAQLDGSSSYLSGGIPKAETGATLATKYTLGSIPVTINGTAASASKLKLQLSNVNGTSTVVELPTEINVLTTASSGIDETAIPVSPTLGLGYTDNGKRIAIPGATGGTPVYTPSIDYFTSYAFAGNVPVASTDAAIVRFGTMINDTTDYSVFLPVGPNLSGRSGIQYFRFAFHRTVVANFTINFTGKISGLWIAAPGTQIDTTSTLDGWLDATQVYAGAGIPGANTGAGGNGSNGCAKTAGDVVLVHQQVTNRAFKLTLGSENSSNATGDTVLVSIALAVGDSLSSISVS
jgi:hypothetical protein